MDMSDLLWRKTNYQDIDPDGRLSSSKDLWLGLQNGTVAYYLWYDNVIGNWIISDHLGPRIFVDGIEVQTYFWYSYAQWKSGEVYVSSYELAGRSPGRYYRLASGQYLWKLQFSGSSLWVISDKLGGGIREKWIEDHYILSPQEETVSPALSSPSPSPVDGTYSYHVDSKYLLEDVVIKECDYRDTSVNDTDYLCGKTFTPDDAGDPEGPGTWGICYQNVTSSFILLLYNSYYTGDSWWSSSSLEGVYNARGSGRGTKEGGYTGTPKEVYWYITGYIRDNWSGWDSSDEPLGRYIPYSRTVAPDSGSPDGMENSADEVYPSPSDTFTSSYLYVGLPRWEDGTGTVYTRSLETGDTGYYTYGDIYHDGTGWVIGTRGSEEGWYEGTEPVIDPSGPDDNVFYWTSPDGSSLSPDGSSLSPDPDITLSFVKFIQGDNNETVLLADTARFLG